MRPQYCSLAYQYFSRAIFDAVHLREFRFRSGDRDLRVAIY
jgi:hypothetical protein